MLGANLWVIEKTRALLVEDLPALILLLRENGYDVVNDCALTGFSRVFITDPFGNWIELMERLL